MIGNLITLAVVIAGMVVVGVAYRNQPWNAMRVAGAVITLASLVVFAAARIQLGSAFAIRAKAQKLVTRGVYSKIRNPIYIFGGLMLAGLCLFVNHPEFLLVFLVLVPLQVARARREERVLTEKFGEEYLRYKRSTWF